METKTITIQISGKNATKVTAALVNLLREDLEEVMDDGLEFDLPSDHNNKVNGFNSSEDLTVTVSYR